MQKLLLIKHAAPLVDPAKSSDQWKLSEAGREQARRLAEKLATMQIQSIISSEEPKAKETADIIAGQLGLTASTAADLHEHDRRNVPHMRSRDFISMMELFFRKPDERVLGSESAREAFERFTTAIDAVTESHPAGNLAIVAHGTVIALFLAAHSQRDGFELWREMGLPSYAVLSLPDRNVEQVDSLPRE
ncbi:MAG TPA: histidine phosphatase family protein [Tepidisphaeraceae bacterium]|jgi:broad specificity phosphatase PhoE|nr:histidine phosphatase family protein [Tepidisphaeraceae bacterium]